LVDEIIIAWHFVVYDLSATVMPAMLFVVAAIHSTQLSPLKTLFVAGRGLIYFFLYIFVFCVSNQLHGVEEDRLNKPKRPLPSGMVTPQGAVIRWYIGMILFTLVGWLFGVVEWALLWQLSLLINNFTPARRMWLYKHINITVGTFAMMAAAWQIVTPLTPIAWQWVIATSLLVFPLITVQDLRDIEGDAAVQRRTLPIVMGEWPTRLFIAVWFLFAPWITHITMFAPLGLNIQALVCELGLTVTCVVVAVRTVFMRTREADHRSYMLFTYWYCFLLASAIIVL
jgi:4-hydroxybenzoate polyprenyltransferase